MKFIIYHENNFDNSIFHDFAISNSLKLKNEKVYFGNRTTFESDNDFQDEFIKFIAVYITENFLCDYILNKIYDEYTNISIGETTYVLNRLSEELTKSEFLSVIKKVLEKNNSINIDSFVLFNIKNIMLTGNVLADKICAEIIENKERQAFLNVIRSYQHFLDHEKQSVNVEFVSDDNVSVVFDNNEKVNIKPYELISFLSERQPEEIIIKNKNFSPELTQMLTDFFQDNI